MPDKINPATLGRASTGQTFITEANHDYSRFGVGAEPRTLKFDVISSLIDVSSQAWETARNSVGAESGPAHG